MRPISLMVMLILGLQVTSVGQTVSKPDTGLPGTTSWDSAFQVVEMNSSLDGTVQKAYYRRSQAAADMPLLISLHSWSADYTQYDSLALSALTRDWHYIHPDFRGANSRYEACGSRYVLSDIDDAIQFAIDQGNVDINNIHVIGSSGGGHATLMAYMRSRHKIRSFSAWVPISHLGEWYFESLGRNNKYANDILLCTKSTSDSLNHQELLMRSPICFTTPLRERVNSHLFIYAGIHDGYEGSVPITHSIQFYNKVVLDLGGTSNDVVAQEIMLDLVKMRAYPEKTNQRIGGRQIIFQRQFENISLMIFDGGHEMLSAPAIEMLPIVSQDE